MKFIAQKDSTAYSRNYLKQQTVEDLGKRELQIPLPVMSMSVSHWRHFFVYNDTTVGAEYQQRQKHNC